MNTYISTFYTHAGALISCRNLKGAGISAKMMPVPRKLSSSCGTCLTYESEDPLPGFMDEDLEGMYKVEGENYIKL